MNPAWQKHSKESKIQGDIPDPANECFDQQKYSSLRGR